MKRLEPSEAGALLTGSPEWRYDGARGGTITREFVFANFVQAFGFMTEVALLAEKCDHHPEWSNVYARVRIVLTTHDANGLSMKDIELARLIDSAYALRQVPAQVPAQTPAQTPAQAPAA